MLSIIAFADTLDACDNFSQTRYIFDAFAVLYECVCQMLFGKLQTRPNNNLSTSAVTNK